MNAPSPGVPFPAAKMRSPSFSRSSSSMTTTALPAAMSATARSTESNLVIFATLAGSGRNHRRRFQYEPRRRGDYCQLPAAGLSAGVTRRGVIRNTFDGVAGHLAEHIGIIRRGDGDSGRHVTRDVGAATHANVAAVC